MNVKLKFRTFIQLDEENNRDSIMQLLDLLENQFLEVSKLNTQPVSTDKVEIPLSNDMFPSAPSEKTPTSPRFSLWLLWTTYMLILCHWKGVVVPLKTQYTSDEFIANYNLIYDKVTTYYMDLLEEL